MSFCESDPGRCTALRLQDLSEQFWCSQDTAGEDKNQERVSAIGGDGQLLCARSVLL